MSIRPPFIIFGLPRSRTYWLSRFLSFGDWECYHDRAVWMRSLADVKAWFAQPNVGTVETAAAPFWRHILRVRPDLRVVTVRRAPEECLKSWLRIMPNADARVTENNLRRLDRKLDQIEARVPGSLRVNFDELSTFPVLSALFEHCLGLPLPPNDAASMFTRDLQINVAAQLRYMQANAPAIEKLYGQVRQAEFASLARKPINGNLAFGWENAHDFWRDGQPLFAAHMLRTDQSIEDFKRKNLPLMLNLYEMGALKIAGARCNGRLVAYSLIVISPSLDSPNAVMAEFTTTYADAAFPGAFFKLERAAEEMLRAEGVTEFQARAGVRGDGSRLDALWKRRGFEEFGRIYRKEVA